jgi:hypothetical protein
MFWVTQAGCAKAIELVIEIKETREISVPARTDNELVISTPGTDESCWLVLMRSMPGHPCAVKHSHAALQQWPPCSNRTGTVIPLMA